MRGQRVNYWEKVKRIQPINWVKEQLKKLFLLLWRKFKRSQLIIWVDKQLKKLFLFLWRKFKRIQPINWVDKQLKKLFLPLWLSRFILVCLLASIGGSAFVYKVICGDNAVDSVFKVLGGGFALIALAIASWRSLITEKQVNSDRFVKSVEQVANQNLAIRLGGLASLHALSKENKEEYQEVWAYLGSFLRHRPPLDKDESTSPFPDVAYIVKMLKERNKKRIDDYESEFKLDLSAAHLSEANLEGADLEGVDLRRAHLERADLVGADLDGADLRDAHLAEANLKGANLRRADLRGVNLWEANLWEAHLEGADLTRAHLDAASLTRAYLEGADLDSAILKGTNLDGANLVGANLVGADLVGANLVGALFGEKNGAQDLTKLTPENLKGTYYLNDDGYHVPKLPDNLPEECKPMPISYLEWDQIWRPKKIEK